ncbi:MAG TPA: N-acetylmuramoyl-L-alanine amidase, partial [Luteimonas sp.]|nr:N-acetylmuramoyl-L-alanine amidase [Luteimonas sp.]
GIHGSAFFIAPNLLLTAAHVVDGQSALIIVPGKNGAGTTAANEPFGRIRVGAADMAMHPSYAPHSRDFDLALIRVPAAQASPNYFGLVEELTQSRPEGVVVSGYAAYSEPVDTVDRVVNALVDPDRQHMHGGYIRSLPSAETFDYDLQSLGGTSGSPVYYIEDGAAPRTHMVGVHVAGAGDTTNLGCRITPAKLAWIRTQAAAWGHALSFSLAARGLAEDGGALAAGSGAEADEDTFACNPEPVDDDTAGSVAQGRALDARQPDYPGASRFVPAHRANFRSGRRRGATIDRIVIHITAGGPSIDGTIGWFQNPDHTNPRTGRNNPSSAHYIVGRDGEVVQMVGDADTAYHASSANARSIGIEHNANKPYRLNRRDLPPTDPQYEASAQLVAWLAARHGVPLDRQHIVGHAEASPGDNHDCPSAYWDWDRYMDCLHAAADALAQAGAASPTPSAPSTAQGVRRRGAPVRAQELITPYYDPSDPASALTCTADAFSASREEWYVGVEDTHAFPHAAICQLTMTDAEGRSARGTGFYIGRDRILTCAHNLHGMERVTVVPGRNGAGDAPHGQCTLPASSWRVASRYTGDGDWDNDLAVIDGVPIAAPGGRFFRFLQATPGESMPLAVCGYSTASRLVRELNPVFDGDRQHLHGGHAQGMPTADTIDYDILALAGASGSPVYTVRDSGDGPEALVCAVHVTRGPIAGGAGNGPSVNRGCFVTPAKIEWIEGRATAFAHRGARALAVDAIEHDVRLVPQPDKNACWAASMAMLLGFRGARSVDPEALAREVGGSLSTSYDWDLLQRVSAAHGFVVLEQPSNTSLYHAPTQWAAWLREFGPLWVVIVGAPHAVVLAGIRGELADPASVEVKVLNPWDTQTAFDATDPIRFDPPNQGYEGWLPFEQFAADFGEMAEPDYGNWRVLHLPASASVAAAQSLAARRDRRLAAPPKARMLASDAAASDAIDPPRVTGTRMRVERGSAGATRWQLDQLEGRKSPAAARGNAGAAGSEVLVDLGAWPAIDGQPAPLPLTVAFRGHADGAVGDVAIRAGAPATLGYGVEVVARIDDHADIDGVAAVKVGIDVRFVGLVDGAPAARIDLTLLGDGRYQRTNRWLDATRAA